MESNPQSILIQKMKKQTGMSYLQASKKCGVSVNYVGIIARGERICSENTLKKILTSGFKIEKGIASKLVEKTTEIMKERQQYKTLEKLLSPQEFISIMQSRAWGKLMETIKEKLGIINKEQEKKGNE